MRKVLVCVLLFVLTAGALFAVKIDNDYFSFTVPDNMEVQDSVISEAIEDLELTEYDFKVTLQQKDPRYYGRIIVKCTEIADEPYTNRQVKADWDATSYSERKLIEDLFYDSFEENSAGLFSLVEKGQFSLVRFTGFYATKIDYVRTSAVGDEDVYVAMYTINNGTRKYDITYSSRVSERAIWDKSLADFEYTLRLKPGSSAQTQLTNTKRQDPLHAVSFEWSSEPRWNYDNSSGLSTYSFEGIVPQTGGEVSVTVMTIDMSPFRPTQSDKWNALQGFYSSMTSSVANSVRRNPQVRYVELLNEMDRAALTADYESVFTQNGVSTYVATKCFVNGDYYVAVMIYWPASYEKKARDFLNTVQPGRKV